MRFFRNNNQHHETKSIVSQGLQSLLRGGNKTPHEMSLKTQAQHEEIIAEEWTMLLKVLDRFFFVMLLISFVSSSVYYRFHLQLAACFDE